MYASSKKSERMRAQMANMPRIKPRDWAPESLGRVPFRGSLIVTALVPLMAIYEPFIGGFKCTPGGTSSYQSSCGQLARIQYCSGFVPCGGHDPCAPPIRS